LWTKFPRQGAYVFRGSGREEADIGVLSLCKWDVGPTVSLGVHDIVAPATAQQVAFDWDLNPGHDKMRYVWQMGPKGAEIVFIGAQMTCAGIQESDDAAYSPPVQRFRFPLVVGASWRGRSDAAKRTEASTTRVVSTGSLTIEGRSVKVWQVEDHIVITGDQSGSRNETWWYAPSYGMAVKFRIDTSVKQGGASFTSELELTLARGPG
jgi:hypothetical protein